MQHEAIIVGGSCAGVFAAGDIARSGHGISWASADGVMAGVALHRSLFMQGART